jgi:hypothetical protein
MKLVLAAVLLAACHTTDRSAEPPRMAEITVVPRSHQIPPGHVADVRKLFDAHVLSFPISVVSSAGTNTQFVNPTPSFIGDRFVVSATPEIHAELDKLLESLAQSPAQAASGTYAMTYWAIEAEPSGGDTQVPSDLVEIEPVLKSLGALGPRKFHTIDRASTRVLDGARADVKSRSLQVEQTLSVDGSALELQLELQVKDAGIAGQVETKLQLAPDKPIVLGETAMGSASDPAANLVLYVVRAQRAE